MQAIGSLEVKSLPQAIEVIREMEAAHNVWPDDWREAGRNALRDVIEDRTHDRKSRRWRSLRLSLSASIPHKNVGAAPLVSVRGTRWMIVAGDNSVIAGSISALYALTRDIWRQFDIDTCYRKRSADEMAASERPVGVPSDISACRIAVRRSSTSKTGDPSFPGESPGTRRAVPAPARACRRVSQLRS